MALSQKELLLKVIIQQPPQRNPDGSVTYTLSAKQLRKLGILKKGKRRLFRSALQDQAFAIVLFSLLLWELMSKILTRK